MAVFLLTPRDEERLRVARRRAVANVIPRDVVERHAKVASADAIGVVRGKRPDSLPRPQEVELSFGWRVNISCEEQAFGRCLHLSISSPTPERTTPRPEAAELIMRALKCGAVLGVWIEEFTENGQYAGKAVNLLTAL